MYESYAFSTFLIIASKRTHHMTPLHRALIFGLTLFTSICLLNTTIITIISYIGFGSKCAISLVAVKGVFDYHEAIHSAKIYAETVALHHERYVHHIPNMTSLVELCHDGPDVRSDCITKVLLQCEWMRVDNMYLDMLSISDLTTWTNKYPQTTVKKSVWNHPLSRKSEFQAARYSKYFIQTLLNQIQKVINTNEDHHISNNIVCNTSLVDIYIQSNTMAFIPKENEEYIMKYIDYLNGVYDYTYATPLIEGYRLFHDDILEPNAPIYINGVSESIQYVFDIIHAIFKMLIRLSIHATS